MLKASRAATCKACGQTLKRGAKKFCSYRCYSRAPKEFSAVRSCKKCFTQFRIIHAHQTFCDACRQVRLHSPAKRLNCRAYVTCKNCGIKFSRLTRRIRNEQNSFCSPRCVAQWQKGKRHPSWSGGFGRTRITAETWRAKARAIRKRDNHACQVCGGTRNPGYQQLPVDHIVPYRIARIWAPTHEDDEENLLTLCQVHHGIKLKAEKRLDRGDRLGWEEQLRLLGYPMEKVEAAFRHLAGFMQDFT